MNKIYFLKGDVTWEKVTPMPEVGDITWEKVEPELVEPAPELPKVGDTIHMIKNTDEPIGCIDFRSAWDAGQRVFTVKPARKWTGIIVFEGAGCPLLNTYRFTNGDITWEKVTPAPEMPMPEVGDTIKITKHTGDKIGSYEFQVAWDEGQREFTVKHLAESGSPIFEGGLLLNQVYFVRGEVTWELVEPATTNEWGSGYHAEALDRTHTMIVMMGELLDQHPGIGVAGAQKAVDKIMRRLGKLYQKIGSADPSRGG